MYVHSGQLFLKIGEIVSIPTIGGSPGSCLSTPFPIRMSLSAMGVTLIAFATCCPDGSTMRRLRIRLRTGRAGGGAVTTDGIGRLERANTTDVSMQYAN